MAVITTDSSHYQEIAKAIRKKSNSETTYKPADMPAGIYAVYAFGEQVGVGIGYDSGYKKGLAEGSESATARIENDILYVTKAEVGG